MSPIRTLKSPFRDPAQNLTTEQARQYGADFCLLLAVDVALSSPEGIFAWPGVWQITDAAGADFLIALSAWEARPNPEGLERIRTAYRAVLDAWKDAVAAWYIGERAGR